MIICQPSAGPPTCCEFMDVMGIPRPEDSISQHPSPSSRSYTVGCGFTWVHGKKTQKHPKDECLAFPDARRSASGRLTHCCLTKGLFVVIQSTPLANQFPYAKTSYLSAPKETMPIQVPSEKTSLFADSSPNQVFHRL